jgi:hypothetical protein
MCALVNRLEARSYLSGVSFAGPIVSSAPSPVILQEYVVGDFNNDGKADLFTTNVGVNGEDGSVLLGNGDGTSQAPMFVSANTQLLSVAAADFRGGGGDDVFFAIDGFVDTITGGPGNDTAHADANDSFPANPGDVEDILNT